MQTACCIEPTFKEIRAYLADNGEPVGEGDRMEVRWYGHDKRIDWHTYVVLVWGCAVAFTDELVTDDKAG